MHLIFSDAHHWDQFLPLSYTKPVAELRSGILTFSERWKMLLGVSEVAYLTEEHLQKKYKTYLQKEGLLLMPNFIPSEKVLQQIKNLALGDALVYKNEVLAARLDMAHFSLSQIKNMTDVHEDLLFFTTATDLFSLNDKAIDFDFQLLTQGKTSQPLSSTNGFLGHPDDLFIEEGATVEYATLNCQTGKIYIGKNAEIMEGAVVRGSLALCEGAKINMGAKIYGATTIGPHSKVGGEVNNVVIWGYSNKGHEGFLGNSVIGEWCNLGADTNASNLKNNYAEVKLWSYKTKKFEKTGLQFCGIIMGDHSKSAINTQFNTGTVIGVAANIFRSGFLPNLIDHFSWGGHKGDEKFALEKAYDVAEKVMQRRNRHLSQEDKDILKWVFENA